MLKVNDVTVGRERHSDAYECVVTFQVGDMSYNTVKVRLSPEGARAIVEAAISAATATLAVVSTDIKIAGEPVELPLIDEPVPPEFAEVDEAPTVPTVDTSELEEAL